MKRLLLFQVIGPFSLLCFYPLAAFAAQTPRHQAYVSSKALEIAGATSVGQETCAQCHSETTASFRHIFHGQQGVVCQDCHGAASLHVAGGGDVTKIFKFSAHSASEANSVCLSCHQRDQKLHNWHAGRHASNHVRCTECHQSHAPRSDAKPSAEARLGAAREPGLTTISRLQPESVTLQSREVLNDRCLRCHPTERAQLSLPYHHPLREGKMTCMDCHDPHGGGAGKNLRMANVNQLCLECHAQYRGPYMYQHPPVNENCLICHSVHGSPNPNLVTVSQPALCLQCHAGHHDGASLPLVDRCTNCHGSIHGSDVPTPTGGSRFVDKGGLGVPGFPQPGGSATATSYARTITLVGGRRRAPAAISLTPKTRAAYAGASVALPAMLSPFSGMQAALGGMFPMAVGMGGTGSSTAPDDNSWGFSIAPAYRALSKSGFGGRVGEYDSLRSSGGGEFEAGYVSPEHRTTILARGTVISGEDFHLATQINVGESLDVKADFRSFVQQQDNYPFYSGIISPDIITTGSIPTGTEFGIVRTLGNVVARYKIPKTPVYVFVKGDWQTREGHQQLSFLDENIDETCTTCHFTSRLQPVNYTTRGISAGVEVHLGKADVIWEHRYDSFNDRLRFPSAEFGPMLNEIEPVPVFVPDTPAGTYFFDIPAPNEYTADTLRVNWAAAASISFNGQATYRRSRDTFTNNPQNAFDANATVVWNPTERLRITPDYLEQDLINAFDPYFSLFGNVSHHQRWAGVRAEYELTRHLDVEAYYKYSRITRSNAFLWPQIYSINNTDLLTVVPSSSSNTAGAAVRYHSGAWWSGRAGYEFTGTQNPGYLLVPKSNSRMFGNVTLTPVRKLTITNDTSFIVQNAFPIVQRRNRFLAETATATLVPVPSWKFELGYSYQQNNLSTYMAFQNDAAAGYVIDEPFVPYRQLSQVWWFQSSYTMRNRLGFDVGLTSNSAHSGMRPNVNPNDYLLLGNGPLVDQGTFDPALFAQALSAVQYGATQVSQVNVPQLIVQGKVNYLFPHGFDAGVAGYYGSYKDYTNPWLDGILRSLNVYLRRTW